MESQQAVRLIDYRIRLPVFIKNNFSHTGKQRIHMALTNYKIFSYFHIFYFLLFL